MNRRIIVAAIFLLLVSPAWAIDFAQPILGLDGSPLPNAVGKAAPLTLEQIAEDALLANYADEQGAGPTTRPISGDEKVKRYALALKIHDAPNKADVALTIDEAKLLKDLIGKAYGPAVVGPAWHMLEAASAK